MSIRAWSWEGDLTVAGTGDVAEAVEFLKTWRDPLATYNGWWCQEHNTDNCECPTDAWRDPTKARADWYRMVPGCPDWCGEGHTSHIHDAKPHSRGAFPAVVWWWI